MKIIDTDGLSEKTADRKIILSALWLFTILNYLYCDVVTLMDAGFLNQFLTGNVGNMDVTQDFLLAASVLMEIPIAMVLLSRITVHSINRWANMIAAVIMTIVQAATLFGPATPYYIFFSIIEIAATFIIFVIALRWK